MFLRPIQQTTIYINKYILFTFSDISEIKILLVLMKLKQIFF